LEWKTFFIEKSYLLAKTLPNAFSIKFENYEIGYLLLSLSFRLP